MNKSIAFIVAVSLVAVVGVGMAVKSYSDSITVNVAEGGIGIMNGDGQPVGEGMLGLTTRSDLHTYGDLDVDGDANIDGDDLGLGGLDLKVVTGSCADATTTPIAIANPFSSGSASVVYFQYYQPNTATSTISLDIGVAANQYTSADNLIDGLSVATTTAAFETNDYGTNGKGHKSIDSTEYVVGKITVVTAYDGAVLDGGNAYTCTYKAIFAQ